MLVISAGMPRSGSTLLYNILRLLLIEEIPDVIAGWENDVQLQFGSNTLLKTHQPFRYHQQADYTFATVRDVRVCAVSAARMWKSNSYLTMEHIQYCIQCYEQAKQHSNLLIPYEQFYPNHMIEWITRIMGVLQVFMDPYQVYAKSIALVPPNQPGYSKETLLHQNHLTHSTLNHWYKLAPQSLQEQVQQEYGWWFGEYGELLVRKAA